MAKFGGFTELLQKLKIIQIEEDDAPRPVRESGGEPSVYENAYARRTPGRSEPTRAEAVRSDRARSAYGGRLRSGASSHKGGGLATVSEAPVPRADTVVYYISSLSECAAVIKDIIAGVSAVINFDGTDDRTSQRIIDTLAGAAFALNAKVRKITDNTYIIAPKNVNVNMSRHIERRY